MKHYKFICLLAALWGMALCAQAQNAPCTGKAYDTDREHFRAHAFALSGDATASKKKAVITARTTLADLIQKNAQKAITAQNGFGNTEVTQFLSLVQATIRQEAANLKVICEESRQTEGKYRTDVVIEVSKVAVLTGIITQVKNEEALKGKFDEAQFKQAFQ